MIEIYGEQEALLDEDNWQYKKSPKIIGCHSNSRLEGYYELVKPGKTINGEGYSQQLFKITQAIAEKRPEFAIRYEAIIFS